MYAFRDYRSLSSLHLSCLVSRTLSNTLDCLLLRKEHIFNGKLTPAAHQQRIINPKSNNIWSPMYINTEQYSHTHALLLVENSQRSMNVRRIMHTLKIRRHSLRIVPQSRQSHTIHQAVNRFRCEFRLKAKNAPIQRNTSK